MFRSTHSSQAPRQAFAPGAACGSLRASMRRSSAVIRVRIRREAVSYQVRVGNGFLARAGALTRSVHDGDTVALVTDRTVARLYGARAVSSLERAGFRVVPVTLPAGESAKSFQSYRGLCERWSRAGVGRDAVVVALG